MTIDPEVQGMFDASNEVINVARKIRALAAGVLQPVAGDVQPHPDTITAIKAKMETLYDNQWGPAKAAVDEAKATLDAAKTA